MSKARSTLEALGRADLAEKSILVVGAGGLGCEIVKSLAISGFKNLHIIDLDTIDLSNLNRQFLFRKKDIGRPKAVVAAEFIMRRCPGVTVEPHFASLEEMDKMPGFYEQFSLVICGLDSDLARISVCDILVRIAKTTGQVIPFIDGATESWHGQVKVIYPTQTACLYCQLFHLRSAPTTVPVCTVANFPRTPEHCAVYAKELAWEAEKPFDGAKFDADNSDHVQWIVDRAKRHAVEHHLETSGLTISYVKGVIKNIIPAIASTQAIVGSLLVTEAIKLLAGLGQYKTSQVELENKIIDSLNFDHRGKPGCFSWHSRRREDCECCASNPTMKANEDETLEQLLKRIRERPFAPVTLMNDNIVWQDGVREEGLDGPVADMLPLYAYDKEGNCLEIVK